MAAILRLSANEARGACAGRRLALHTIHMDRPTDAWYLILWLTHFLCATHKILITEAGAACSILRFNLLDFLFLSCVRITTTLVSYSNLWFFYYTIQSSRPGLKNNYIKMKVTFSLNSAGSWTELKSEVAFLCISLDGVDLSTTVFYHYVPPTAYCSSTMLLLFNFSDISHLAT